ncbi:MAG: tetratricopeptide repeat protein [Pseudomonadota bacterium]
MIALTHFQPLRPLLRSTPHPSLAVARHGAVAAALAAVAAGLPSAAFAESTKKRVERLEGQVIELQTVTEGTIAATSRIDQLEGEVRTLTGVIERLEYELGQANARLDSMASILAGDAPSFAPMGTVVPGQDGQLTVDPATGVPYGVPVDLTGQNSAAQIQSAQTSPSGQDLAGETFPNGDQNQQGSSFGVELPFDPVEAFSYADTFLLRGELEKAQQAFELYLGAFPSHPRAADAQFRLGEIYLTQGDNTGAADAFIAHIQNYPNDPRAAEAYVKLASAFGRMDQPAEACEVLKTMETSFPGAPPEITSRANRELARNNCS